MSFENIGVQIKKARERANLSQGALAKKANIAQSTLSYIEKGEKSPTMDTVTAICKGLNISVLELLVIDQETSEENKLKNNPTLKKIDLLKSMEREFADFKDYIIEKYGQ
ncbi:MAG: helix-turn-helix transcriptional regulator [Eubacteriales bacterium]